jgi:hypothetical protein
LQNKNITDIHPSTFQNNSLLWFLDTSGSNINFINPSTFSENSVLGKNCIVDIIQTEFLSGINPSYFDLSGNRIKHLDDSVFKKQGQLRTLILSRNMLQRLEPDCTNSRNLSLSANSIALSEISIIAFDGLELLEHLDLSSNNIEDLDPSLFLSFVITSYGPYHQVSNLKHVNLARNKLWPFNFELYLLLSNNSENSSPALKLDYMNVSSNHLTTLDITSVKWLKHTTAVVDLTGNEWVCECSGLGAAWLELRHKLTLKCAYPKQLKGKTRDVLEPLCFNMTDNYSTEDTIDSVTTDRITPLEFSDSDKQIVSLDDIPNVNTETCLGLNKAVLVVNDVLLICTIVYEIVE